jgi:4-aminobutyrate aminotransferase
MSGTDFYYEGLAALAEMLGEIAPGAVSRRVSFGNSGAEAMEGAIKLARWSTGRDKIIAFLGSFHGRTMGALSLTARKAVQRSGFGPMLPGVTHAPYPYCYRCPFGQKPDSCAVECVQHIEQTLLKTISPAEETAAIVMEPVQGEGGYIVPPQKFFDEIARVCKENGILLVFDEVQSGMGRTGKMWAADHFNAVPDIFAVAKGIASGMPLGATVARADLMTWPPGAHASTFGGNPVSCAAALVTIRLLEEGLIENAARTGQYMRERMLSWPKRFPSVGDVRGLGLMIGVELVKDQQTKERAPELRDRVVDLAFERGLLILGAGDNTLRLCPPLIVTRDQCDFALDTLEACLTEAAPRA